MCSLTTMRSCVGSMVKSDKGNLTVSTFVGRIGSSRSGSALDGRGTRRTEYGLDRTS